LPSGIVSRADLEPVREWATTRPSGGQTVGAGHPHLKVRESLDAILARMNYGMAPSGGSFIDAQLIENVVLAWSDGSPDTKH
jgi:hypothetical protein